MSLCRVEKVCYWSGSVIGVKRDHLPNPCRDDDMSLPDSSFPDDERNGDKPVFVVEEGEVVEVVWLDVANAWDSRRLRSCSSNNAALMA